MDEAKAVLHLMVQFPYKSEEYLRKTYRKHQCNMSATINAINDEASTTSAGNVFCNFFESIVDGFQKLCGSKDSTEDLQNTETSPRYEEEFFDINIGEVFAKNLTHKFSDSSFFLPSGFQPVIEIPVALGRQLYAAYVESIFRQQEVHDQIVADLIKEDERFARELQEEVQTDFGYQPQSGFGKLKEFPKVHWISKKDATEAYAHMESFDENDLGLSTFGQPASFYRDQAQKYHQKRKEHYKNAKRYLKVKNRQQANYYFQLAKEQTRLIAQANSFAAAAFLAENGRRYLNKNAIDLHHLYVKEAVEALDVFLDDRILSLKDEGLETKSLMVVTGRGKHSPDGIPKVKPAVVDRLGERSLKAVEYLAANLKLSPEEYDESDNWPEVESGSNDYWEESDSSENVVDGFVDNYREEARMHLKTSRKLRKRAIKYKKSGEKLEAKKYFKEAEKHSEYSKNADKIAYEMVLKNCFKKVSNLSCVDLHGFTVKEAIQVLDHFLDNKIEVLEDEGLSKTCVMVITGQGMHSHDGIPKVKPAVCERLKKRKLKFSEGNPGRLKVHLNSNSLYTEEIDQN